MSERLASSPLTHPVTHLTRPGGLKQSETLRPHSCYDTRRATDLRHDAAFHQPDPRPATPSPRAHFRNSLCNGAYIINMDSPPTQLITLLHHTLSLFHRHVCCRVCRQPRPGSFSCHYCICSPSADSFSMRLPETSLNYRPHLDSPIGLSPISLQLTHSIYSFILAFIHACMPACLPAQGEKGCLNASMCMQRPLSTSSHHSLSSPAPHSCVPFFFLVHSHASFASRNLPLCCTDPSISYSFLSHQQSSAHHPCHSRRSSRQPALCLAVTPACRPLE